MEENKILQVSACGLYCSNCYKFKNAKCPGCYQNSKATWCKVRTCCINNNYKSCAECQNPGIETCKKFNNPIAKLFGYVFNSDRAAGIQLIKEEGYDGFANYLNEINRMAIPRRRS